jgi:hypothetical protein
MMLLATQEIYRQEIAQMEYEELMAQIADYVAEESPVPDEDIPVFEDTPVFEWLTYWLGD